MKLSVSAAVRLAALLALLCFGVFQSRPAASAAPGAQSGFDLSNLDKTCKPCTDFFQFAAGGWIKKHPIPPAYGSWGSFNELYVHNQQVLHGILNAAQAQRAPAGSNLQKIGDFYASCMNVAAIDAGGIKPITALLDAAQNATLENIPQTLAVLHAQGVDAFFGFGSTPDVKNSTVNIGYLGQSGLGLPDRDYYTRTDAKSKQLLAAYQRHVAAMFALLGENQTQAAADAQSVVNVESAMARSQATIVQMRDPNATYHKMSVAQAAAGAPALQLAAYVKDAGVSERAPIDVSVPAYDKALSTQLASMSPADLHAYLRWHVLHAYASALPTAFARENFNFYGKTLSGVKAQLPRWQRCAGAADRNLGDALGQIYVAKTFSPQAKARALAMVKNIKAAFRADLETLSWMSPQTRKRAAAKLDAFLLKIGYPDKWRSYAKLPITRASYAANLIASAKFQTARDLAKIGRPVNRMAWEMTPPTVNAYYDPAINEIVFPAGILQPPFFNPNADMAVNYGGIGAVIGHESTHGFDDEGRQFDAKGNLRNWWTPQDASRFNARAQCVVNQWNQLSPTPGIKENGKQIEGEEIADLGGLTIAYNAFERWQSHHPRRILDGFTPEQRFFLGWAQVWEGSQRAQTIALNAQSDVHGYDKFRVNQTLSDMPQFAKAFFCKLPDKMVRPASQQCKIW